eukprot:TRINITY_DN28032_c0_g1_i1.p1 TRINITY_DN28032_c0_g1~~TRINITY_DN28032_c0_g1_i1.p1  ORF type:complete len:508 (-),score=70.23 TRINITY_DN28032_c0_g1_i1:115-1638(-)
MVEAGQAVEVVTVGGDPVGTFHIDRVATIVDLKQRIFNAGGPPLECQQLLVGDQELLDSQTIAEVGSTVVSLIVEVPKTKSTVKLSWKVEQDTGNLLEDLMIQLRNSSTIVDEKEDGEGGAIQNLVVPNSMISCVGVDAGSGLLLGVKSSEPASYGPPGNEGLRELEGSGGSLFVVLPGGEHFATAIEKSNPVTKACEIHAIHCSQGYPLPSVGIAVALVRRKRNKDGSLVQEDEEEDSEEGDGELEDLGLVEFELIPGILRPVNLCHDNDIEFEAVCLDDATQPPRALCAARHKHGSRWVVARQLRKAAHNVETLFQISVDGRNTTRTTSIAWASAASAVLVTFAGSHAVYVFQQSDKEGWGLTKVIGDPGSRGCQDGPARQVRFWFPSSPQRDYFEARPLVPGEGGIVHVCSGDVLMSLAPDLSSATKVISMQEELWMTERDEGTPEFPQAGGVFGVHKSKVYRTLQRTNFTADIVVRRLEANSCLLGTRLEIRRVAPSLWPDPQ